MQQKKERVTLAIDLGATYIRVGFVRLTKDGMPEIIDQIKDKSVRGNKAALEEQMISLLKQMISMHPDLTFSTAGVSACGIVQDGRTAAQLPNLDVKDLHIADLIEKTIPGVRCLISNDANAAALSESLIGASREYPNSIFFTISSGIGMGYIHQHRLIDVPVEIGHLVTYIGGIGLCEVEQYLSGDGIPRLCEALGLTAVPTPEFFERIRAKDPSYLPVYHLWLKNLGMLIGNLQRMFAVDVFVLGGGVLKSSDVFIEDLLRVSSASALPYPVKPVKFVPSRFGQDAGLLGAAALGFSLKD